MFGSVVTPQKSIFHRENLKATKSCSSFDVEKQLIIFHNTTEPNTLLSIRIHGAILWFVSQLKYQKEENYQLLFFTATMTITCTEVRE